MVQLIVTFFLLIFTNRAFSQFGMGWYNETHGIIIENKINNKISLGVNGYFKLREEPMVRYDRDDNIELEEISEGYNYLFQLNSLYKLGEIQKNNFEFVVSPQFSLFIRDNKSIRKRWDYSNPNMEVEYSNSYIKKLQYGSILGFRPEVLIKNRFSLIGLIGISFNVNDLVLDSRNKRYDTNYEISLVPIDYSFTSISFLIWI